MTGFESKHNLKYWQFAPYFSFGVSAHSFDGENLRWANERDTFAYVKKIESGESPVAEKIELDENSRRAEYAFLGLRLNKGIDLQNYTEKFSIDLAERICRRFGAFEKSRIDRTDQKITCGFQKKEGFIRMKFSAFLFKEENMPISQYLKNLREKVGNEILQIPSVAAIIRNESGKILLVKSFNSEVWGLPAGAIDLGETPAEAIIREVFEETGLNILPEKIIGVFGGEKFRYTYPNGDKVEYLTVVFECKITGGNLENKDGEIIELEYFAVEEMPELAIPYPKSIFAEGGSKTYFE